MWARVCLLLLAWATLGSCVPTREEEEEDALRRIARQAPVFGISHLDIRNAILMMEKSIKGVASKLSRHEAREMQNAVSTTQKLNGIATGLGEAGTGMQVVARQLAVMEERLLSLESLVQTTDERQRMKLDQLTLGLDRLLARDLSFQDLPPLPDAAEGEPEEESAVLKAVKKMSRKLAGVETMIQRDMRAVSDEVTSVGESLGQHMGQLNDRHDRLEAQLGESRALSQVSFQLLNDSLAASSATIQQQIQSQEGGGCSGAGATGVSEEVNTCLETLSLHAIQQKENLENLRQETHRSLEEHLVTLQRILLETHAGQTLLNTSIADLTQSLSRVNTSTQGGLTKLASNIQAVQTDSVGAISALEEKLHEDNTYIKDILEARAAQMEELHNTMLKNVGQVMIQTADSVLDTKRSIEFGVQQIILELSDIVMSSGSTINTTLHDQINKISVAILKNQTSALTNMTARMEQEISQVWRQIGIMYQQMIQSVDLLDELKDTTNEHMNASLSRVGNMDGTVGKINSKVIDVENNLNYLLGRLSLVVSEFNLLKNGVGEELMRLRDNLASQNNSPVEFAEGEEPPADSRYDVNRKRDAPLPHNRAGAF